MRGEYISIETLRIWQEQEKENVELQEKINLILEEINKIKNIDLTEYNFCIFIDKIKNIIGDSNE